MTNTDTTTNSTAVVADYLAMWLESDEAVRNQQIARLFTEDGRHVDPNADARGHDGIAAMMTAVHGQFPGFTMRQTSAVDAHNDQFRFSWELFGADGTLVVNGIDAGQIAEDGRIQTVTGFWGDLS
jgi:hypothetical protein